MLVHGKTNGAMKSTNLSCKPGFDNCNRLSRNDVADTSSQNVHAPAVDIICRTRNAVYGIIRMKYKSTVYVGETELELRERMTGHIRDPRLERDKLINFLLWGRRTHTE